MPEEVLRFEAVWYASDTSKDHVDNVSFGLNRGEGMVISGPEGSGKSQLMNLIMAKSYPKSGRIFYNGSNIHVQQDLEIERLRFSIGYVSQTAGLINNLSVLENIILPLRYHTELKDEELFAAAEFWIDRYELAHKMNSRPVGLSTSETIRTALIRALIVEPRIVLLDAVLDGICPLAAQKIWDLVFEDITLRGMTYIISTYHPASFAKRDLQFMLLYRGEVVFQGRTADIMKAGNVFLEQYKNLSPVGPMSSFNETL